MCERNIYMVQIQKDSDKGTNGKYIFHMLLTEDFTS